MGVVALGPAPAFLRGGFGSTPSTGKTKRRPQRARDGSLRGGRRGRLGHDDADADAGEIPTGPPKLREPGCLIPKWAAWRPPAHCWARYDGTNPNRP